MASQGRKVQLHSPTHPGSNAWCNWEEVHSPKEQAVGHPHIHRLAFTAFLLKEKPVEDDIICFLFLNIVQLLVSEQLNPFQTLSSLGMQSDFQTFINFLLKMICALLNKTNNLLNIRSYCINNLV